MAPLLNNPNDNVSTTKRHMLVMGVVFVGIALYTLLMPPRAPEPVPVKPVPAAGQVDSALKTALLPTPDSAALPVAVLKPLPVEVLTTPYAAYSFAPTSGSLDALSLTQFRRATDPDSPTVLFSEIPAWRPQWGTYEPTAAVFQKTDSALTSVRTLRNAEAQTLEATETLSLLSPVVKAEGVPYEYYLTFTLKNTGKAPVNVPMLTLSTGGLPNQLHLSGDVSFSEGFYMTFADASGAIENQSFDEDPEDYIEAVRDRKARWIATQNKYIMSVLVPDTALFEDLRMNRVELKVPGEKAPVVFLEMTGRCQPPAAVLQPGESCSLSFYAYAGPKALNWIKTFDSSVYSAVEISYFSWFEWLSRMFLYALLWINDTVCHNFGWSIVVLTLIVKALFHPIQRRSTESMKKMQTLQPKMQEIREKYKDNPQLMNQKTMELYKEEGVNPVSGCLPMLLQLPIFIALYAALNGSVEIRGESFLWIADLTKPDNVGALFGIPIHPLILAETVLMMGQTFLSQSASPAGPQQKMMLIMPLVILFFFYNLPAGLTLYMTISMVPQVAHELYIRFIKNKQTEPKTEKTV